jgi:hypothetical protein
MATTERADCSFSTKEHRDGEPFIMFDVSGTELKAIGNGFLSLELRGGVSLEQAKELVQRLNDLVEQISHTTFSSAEST